MGYLMKKTSLFLAMAGLVATTVPVAASAQDSGWAVRLGVTPITWANKSDAFDGVPADAVHVKNKTIPEIDVFYSFTKNIVGEVVLTYPQTFRATVSGADIGSFKALPPSFLAQYHFLPDGKFDPYLGVGLNVTLISGVSLAGNSLTLSKTSTGVAAQVGGDFNIDKQWFLNVDAKYITMKADVKTMAGATVTKLTLDPILYSVGVGYRF